VNGHQGKELVSTLGDNLREVMNICMGLILNRLRRKQVVAAKQMPPPVAATANSDFAVGHGQ